MTTMERCLTRNTTRQMNYSPPFFRILTKINGTSIYHVACGAQLWRNKKKKMMLKQVFVMDEKNKNYKHLGP
jgi:hypothetical protein